jgi:hypothetical protein
MLYWVARIMREPLAEELRFFRLFTCWTNRGYLWLFAAKLPKGDSNSGRSWIDSALEGADKARHVWVRMKADSSLGAYRITIARGDLGNPPWPDVSHKEIIKIAFKAHTVNTAEHPIVRDLRGEI